MEERGQPTDPFDSIEDLCHNLETYKLWALAGLSF